MDLITHIPGVGPVASFNPGATTPAPYNVPQTGALDGTGPGTATKNVAELYNRDLLWRRALIAASGLAFDPTNWVQEMQAVQAIAAAAAAATAVPLSLGQCQLTKSGANLVLVPKKGFRMMINGVMCTIPAAGVSLAPPATPSTTFYIYATAAAGVVTALEASATGHSADATATPNQGVEIKTGDATRSLVGMARTTSGNAWVDTRAQRFVRSWFNDPGVEGGNAFAANRSTTSATYVELSSTERVEFLSWLGETIAVATGGKMTNTAVDGRNAHISVGFDGIAPIDAWGYVGYGGGSVNTAASCTGSISTLAEGYHYATILGSAPAAGTAVFEGSATVGIRTNITVLIG